MHSLIAIGNSAGNSAFFKTTLNGFFTANAHRSPTFVQMAGVVKQVALLALNCYASWGQPTVYALSFMLGATLLYDVVPTQISDRIGRVYVIAFAVTFVFMHITNLPAVMITQAILFGADLGRRTIDFCSAAPDPV